MSTTEAGQDSPAIKLKTSTRAISLVGLALFLILFLAGGAWAYFAKISGAVIASGRVVVLGEPKTVQHYDGGIVSMINVDNGQRVRRGEELIRINDTLLKANHNIYQTRLSDRIAQRARLVAERDGKLDIDWAHPILTLFDLELAGEVRSSQQRIFDAQRESRRGQILQLRERIKQLRSQAKGIEAQAASKDAQMSFLDEELEAVSSLNKKGLANKSRLLALQRQREEMVSQKAGQGSELARLKNSIGEIEIEILQIDRESRKTVLEELNRAEQDINEYVQQLHATREKLDRVAITSPVDGIVHQLNVFTIGGVLRAGEPLLKIIPQEGAFEITADVEPQFINELAAGQEAAIRFSSFNQRTTPELTGTVRSISPDVISDPRSGASFYRLRLEVSESELARLPGQPLPGMPVDVFMQTEQRSALDYLVKPLSDQLRKVFRER